MSNKCTKIAIVTASLFLVAGCSYLPSIHWPWSKQEQVQTVPTPQPKPKVEEKKTNVKSSRISSNVLKDTKKPVQTKQKVVKEKEKPKAKVSPTKPHGSNQAAVSGSDSSLHTGSVPSVSYDRRTREESTSN